MLNYKTNYKQFKIYRNCILVLETFYLINAYLWKYFEENGGGGGGKEGERKISTCEYK